jgi:hypothetical protein
LDQVVAELSKLELIMSQKSKFFETKKGQKMVLSERTKKISLYSLIFMVIAGLGYGGYSMVSQSGKEMSYQGSSMRHRSVAENNFAPEARSSSFANYQSMPTAVHKSEKHVRHVAKGKHHHKGKKVSQHGHKKHGKKLSKAKHKKHKKHKLVKGHKKHKKQKLVKGHKKHKKTNKTAA